MSTFEEFQTEFFRIFSVRNFYEGKSYLEYVSEPQTNDEDNIVDIKIVLPLLIALGFESGDIAKNTTESGKDNARPDFQIRLASGNIRCFLVEDKHTGYDLSKPEPLQQLVNYAPSRGYELGLICNGISLLGWDLSNQTDPHPVLHLNLQKIISTYQGKSLMAEAMLADAQTGLDALTLEQVQDLKGLYRRFHKQNFEAVVTLIQEIGKPESEWLKTAKSQQNTPDFDELLIADLKAAINLLEEDVLYQLNLLLEEYEQYSQAQYLPNSNGNGNSFNVNAIKTQQYFISWCNLITKTVLHDADDLKLKEEFAKQTAYVYVIRLLMVRICEDKKLLNRKFLNGEFKYWKEEVEPRYLDLAQGISMDYLLEMSYHSAQNIYAHFFNSADLFNWYRMNTNTLIKVLHILNRFNLQQIDSDIIGMVYGRYVEQGKHEQGRYFTPKQVVEYILDCIGYTSDNPEIRDQKLLDLAGGSGSFLVHAARRLIESYRSRKTKEFPIEYVPLIIQKVKDSLYCLDINPFACYLAETNLLIQVVDLLKQAKDANRFQECTIDRFNVYNTDSLLLPKPQEIRTPLLNPILDLELSTISEIKTKTGKFADGFDVIVGNPPYVRADEPGVDSYRREIEQTGRFETLHEKWDLFVPFVELACQSVSQSGKIGLIVSRGFQTNNYAEILRNEIANKLTICQVDFFNNVQLFSDAVVNNTVFFLENNPPDQKHKTKRFLHIGSLEEITVLESLTQSKYRSKVFRQFVMTENFDNVIDLEDICYCSIGMVLNADETIEKGAFKKADLLSEEYDEVHSKKYIDGENIIREFCIDKVRYLEWKTPRVPGQIRRATIPELYDYPKILFGMTSFPTYDRGLSSQDGFYVPDSVRICVRWDFVYKIKRLEEEKRQMYEVSKKRQRALGSTKGKKIQIYQYAQDKANFAKQFDLRYIAAILASSFGKRCLLLNNRDENIMTVNPETALAKSRIYPDDLKEFPIKSISLEEQQPFIDRVDRLIEWNWEISRMNQLEHKIKFDYQRTKPTIEISFLHTFNQLNPVCWSFLDAEPYRFEVIGDRTRPVTKIKRKEDTLWSGREALLHSDSPLVLEFLQNYLIQYEKRGLSWTDLLTEGKIPKTDAAIAEIFAERDRVATAIQQRIKNIQQTYQELDEMVIDLYQSISKS